MTAMKKKEKKRGNLLKNMTGTKSRMNLKRFWRGLFNIKKEFDEYLHSSFLPLDLILTKEEEK